MIWEDGKGTVIKAKEIHIEEGAMLGSDIDVDVRGVFKLGRRSILGDRAIIRGNNITFGNDLFSTAGLKVGWGGASNPDANLTVGDRCTCHDNLLNVFEPIVIGDDVGLSNEVTIYTHGYWMSVLEGYPARFAGVTIKDKVIVGYRSIILMGVTIGEGAVIGAGSVVVKDVESKHIVAGNPAKFIGKISPIFSMNERESMIREILARYEKVAEFHGVNPKIVVQYPLIRVNDSWFNVETLAWKGKPDLEVDDFRDYVRHWGLRFYGRPFRSA